jgi:hypothetical protein
MSNALAIAAVTRALLDLLNEGLINNNVGSSVGGPIRVTALPPDRVLGSQPPNGNTDPTQLNLYLYQVTFNAGWRQTELPTRDARGDFVSAPLLPLNLHYLLTAYGDVDLNSELLLGYAMQLLHENPVLDRASLRKTLGAVSTAALPPAYQALQASDLAEQVELIKLTPEAMSFDEMSKIWTSLQTHYRTSASYQASVVLIESRRARRTPLPVLTRGRRDQITGREPGVFVQPDLLPPVPTLSSIVPPHEQIAARLGEAVEIRGVRLDADQAIVRFSDPRTLEFVELQAVVTSTRLTVQLPTGPGLGGADPTLGTDSDNWRCGVYQVTARLTTGLDPERTTNALPMALAPTLVSISAATVGGVTTFTAHCLPPLHSGQRASLIVGERELLLLVPDPPPADPPPFTDTLEFAGKDFTSGSTPFVRLRIDGVDSLLVDRSTTPPRFAPGQQVAIP